MIELFGTFKSDPFFFSVIAVAGGIVGLLLFSDWSDKRRARRLVQLQRAANETRLSRDPAAAQSTTPRRMSRAPFRLFRWEFLLLSVVCTAIVLPMVRSGNQRVYARAIPQTSAGDTRAAVSTQTERVLPTPVSEFSATVTLATTGHAEFVPMLAPGVSQSELTELLGRLAEPEQDMLEDVLDLRSLSGMAENEIGIDLRAFENPKREIMSENLPAAFSLESSFSPF